MSDQVRSQPERTIGFWLELSPGQPIIGEGIGQYTARLLKAMTRELGTTCVIFTPSWALATIREFLAAAEIDPSRIDVQTRGSAILGRWLEAKLSHTGKRAGAPVGKLRADSTAPIDRSLLARLRRSPRSLARHGFNLYRHRVLAALARSASNDERIKAVIVPIGTWEGARAIRSKRLVVHIPDVVFVEFPEYFKADPHIPETIAKIRRVGACAGAVACASEHVRTNHLTSYLGLDPNKVHVLRHATMKLDEIEPSYLRLSKSQARQQLVLATGQLTGCTAVLAREDGRPATVLYYPTQDRPYKNIFQVIEAIAILNHSEPGSTHLLLTGNLSARPDLLSAITGFGLGHQVHHLGRLPQQMHALAFRAADLGVTASSFEGGFPFVFAEGVSMGTPVLMARIPVTEPEIPSSLSRRMLFDGTQAGSLAALVVSALMDEHLLADQQILLSRQSARSWRDVAADYLALAHPGQDG